MNEAISVRCLNLLKRVSIQKDFSISGGIAKNKGMVAKITEKVGLKPFMAGGIAVVCGHHPQNPENVMGHRPCVGMVGGKIFFRGPHKGYSPVDSRLAPIGEDDWEWLTRNMRKLPRNRSALRALRSA